jgi:hypothetical protein
MLLGEEEEFTNLTKCSDQVTKFHRVRTNSSLLGVFTF